MPLLLQMSELLPAKARTRHGRYSTIVLEEPEMGLHPRAIGCVMMLVFDALARSYRVVLSTHSTDVLDAATLRPPKKPTWSSTTTIFQCVLKLTLKGRRRLNKGRKGAVAADKAIIQQVRVLPCQLPDSDT